MGSILDCLEERGLLDNITSPDLKEHLQTPRKVYCGFDPTADSLHVGSLLPMIVLRWFQKFGHTPVVILGGATGKIGDPSGKSTERPLLTTEAIEYNVSRIRRHFEAVLDFFHMKNRPLLLNNNDWFSTFSLVDFLRDVGKHFRLGTMLAKESVKSRLQSEEGISFTEFTYQILQSYDFYHLYKEHQVSLQIGGSDQWGNITEGVDLVRRFCSQQAFGLTMPLLTRSDGKKFGKSEQGAVWLSSDRCSYYEFYQYFMRIPDLDVIRMLKMLTFLDLSEIKSLEAKMKQADYVPNTAQKKLAEEVTRLVHGEEGLSHAIQVTETASPGAKTKLDVETLSALAKEIDSAEVSLQEMVDKKLVELFVQTGFLASRGEGVRLIQNGGAYLNNERIEDAQRVVLASDLIGGEFLLVGSGKKKKMVIRIKNQ